MSVDVSGLRGFYEIAQQDPGRRAVIDADDSTTTYGELLAQVNRVSNGLRALGLTKGDVVAGVLPNGVAQLEMLLATGQLGLYYTPVNWHLTVPEIAYILDDCDAKVVVAAQPYAQAVHQACDEAGVRPDRRFATPAEIGEGQSDAAPDDRIAGNIMWYTSGTTGRPKGVQRPLTDAPPEDIVPLYVWYLDEVCALKPGDERHLVTSPMYHSSPCAHSVFALHLGHTNVIAPRFDPETILELVQRHRITNAMMVPTMFHRMLRLPEAVRAKYDISSLQQVVHTGAACPVAVKKGIMDWWGPVLYEYYGSTESAIAFYVKPQDWLAHPGTVGRPAPGYAAKILDEEGNELPPGEAGLVYVQGVTAVFEYRKDPAKTASTKHGDFYTPGDIGYLDDGGYLHLLDRRTDLIVSGGVNIYPAEIEAALLEHPAVADAAVIGVPDEEWGHKVVALIQPTDGVVTDPELTEELLKHCEPRIARFKHPRVIEYRADLPRTPTGKLSRSKVRADYLNA